MNKQTHIMHITFDMRIGGTEMVIKNIIDGLHNLSYSHSPSPSSLNAHNPSSSNVSSLSSSKCLVEDPTIDSGQDNARMTNVRTPNPLVGDPTLSIPTIHTETGAPESIEWAEKFRMSVLCIESPLGPFAEELQNNGIEFHQFNRKQGFDTNLIKQIRKAIKTNNVDIIHCHQYTPWVYGVIAAAFTKTKVIFTEHGRFYPDSSTWKRKLINPILNLFTDQVTAISKATKQALTEFENIPEKSIDVIYNGITPLKINQVEVDKLREKLAIPKNHTILGTIARFDPIKNHTMMLNAFSLVLKQQPNTTLIIVGDGDERTNIEACINKLNISENVMLTGYQIQPKNYLALMNIYLLSSFSEGTSMTLLEAMSLSKPCVVTNVGGNPEVVMNSKSGFVTPNDNAIKFAQGIMKTIKSTMISEGLGRVSKNRFDKCFSEAAMNEQYQKLYIK